MMLAHRAFSSTKGHRAGSLTARYRTEKLQRLSPVIPQKARSLFDRQNQATPAMLPKKTANHSKLTLEFSPPLMGPLIQTSHELSVSNKVPMAVTDLIGLRPSTGGAWHPAAAPARVV